MAKTVINEELESQWMEDQWIDVIEEMTEDIVEVFISFAEEEMFKDECITEIISLKKRITQIVRDSLFFFRNDVNEIIRDATLKEFFQRIDKILRCREGVSINNLSPLERLEIEDILEE